MKTKQKRSLRQILHDVIADQLYMMAMNHDAQENNLRTVLEMHRKLC